MTGLILDASAVLAAILDEPGGDVVFDRLEEAAVSTVNVAEVYSYVALRGVPADAVDAFLNETGVEIVPFALDQAALAGQYAAITRAAGLSLGDRACLALAKTRQAEVLTADRVWTRIAAAVELTITMLR